MKANVFKGRNGKWRWHIRAGNGKLVATSGEDFDSRGNALRAVKAFLRNVFKVLSVGDLPVEVSDD